MNHVNGFLVAMFLTVSVCGCLDPDSDEGSDGYGDMDVSGLRIGGNLLITNNNSWDWWGVELELNGEYTYATPRIEGGSTLTIPLNSFTDGSGYRFNYLSQACKSMKIRCETPSGDEKYWP